MLLLKIENNTCILTIKEKTLAFLLKACFITAALMVVSNFIEWRWSEKVPTEYLKKSSACVFMIYDVNGGLHSLLFYIRNIWNKQISDSE